MTMPKRRTGAINGGDARRVLIVEHEMMVAMLIEDVLTEHGFEIAGFATTVDQALELVGKGEFEAAVLDLNLSGAQTYPVADALASRGIPFVFSTGYGAAGVEAAYRQIRLVQKPFEERDLIEAIGEAIGGK